MGLSGIEHNILIRLSKRVGPLQQRRAQGLFCFFRFFSLLTAINVFVQQSQWLKWDFRLCSESRTRNLESGPIVATALITDPKSEDTLSFTNRPGLSGDWRPPASHGHGHVTRNLPQREGSECQGARQTLTSWWWRRQTPVYCRRSKMQFILCHSESVNFRLPGGRFMYEFLVWLKNWRF
jgi:hypothetical protein